MSNLQLMPVIDAIEAVTGLRPVKSTVLRWCRTSRPVFLESWKLGGRRLTTKEAVEKFIKESTKEAEIGKPANLMAKQAEKKTPQPAVVTKVTSNPSWQVNNEDIEFDGFDIF